MSFPSLAAELMSGNCFADRLWDSHLIGVRRACSAETIVLTNVSLFLSRCVSPYFVHAFQMRWKRMWRGWWYDSIHSTLATITTTETLNAMSLVVKWMRKCQISNMILVFLRSQPFPFNCILYLSDEMMLLLLCCTCRRMRFHAIERCFSLWWYSWRRAIVMHTMPCPSAKVVAKSHKPSSPHHSHTITHCNSNVII